MYSRRINLIDLEWGFAAALGFGMNCALRHQKSHFPASHLRGDDADLHADHATAGKGLRLHTWRQANGQREDSCAQQIVFRQGALDRIEQASGVNRHNL
jgi:hypothetical protein